MSAIIAKLEVDDRTLVALLAVQQGVLERCKGFHHSYVLCEPYGGARSTTTLLGFSLNHEAFTDLLHSDRHNDGS